MRIVARHRVAGGDLNDAYRVELEDGRSAFLKTRAGARPGEYAAEAAGLQRLGEADALRVPEVLSVGDDHLVLEWVEPGRLDAAGEEELGRGLAAVHAAGEDGFGGPQPLHLGPLALPNARPTPEAPLAATGTGGACPPVPGPNPNAPAGTGGARPHAPAPAPNAPSTAAPARGGDWPAFYAECRLRPLLDRAGLSPAGVRAVASVCDRLPDLAGPPEPPARLHGDLWSGNVLAGRDGRPWLVDPAVYGGHREVDLAMLRLFGAPSPRVPAAYAEVAPLADGHEERVGLWQLFPLLVHAARFGGSYRAAVERTARTYS